MVMLVFMLFYLSFFSYFNLRVFFNIHFFLKKSGSLVNIFFFLKNDAGVDICSLFSKCNFLYTDSFLASPHSSHFSSSQCTVISCICFSFLSSPRNT